MQNFSDAEFRAFILACEKNGVKVSRAQQKTPNNPVIVGMNGERYVITQDMRKVAVSRKVAGSASLTRKGALARVRKKTKKPRLHIGK